MEMETTYSPSSSRSRSSLPGDALETSIERQQHLSLPTLTPLYLRRQQQTQQQQQPQLLPPRRTSQPSSTRRSRQTSTIVFMPTVPDDDEEIYFPLSPPPPPLRYSQLSQWSALPSPLQPSPQAIYPEYGYPSHVRQAHSSLASSGLLPDVSTYQQHVQQQHPENHNRRIVHESASGPPSVYWSDDATSFTTTNPETATIRTMGTVSTTTNPSAFTFYRESTPPPRDYDDDDDFYDEDDGGDLDKRTSYVPSWSSRKSKQQESGVFGTTGTIGPTGRIGSAPPVPPAAAAAADEQGPGAKRNTAKTSISIALSDRDDHRTTADFEFVNGRYVPPGMREGRMPGRIPPGAAALGIEKSGRSHLGLPGSSAAAEDIGSLHHPRSKSYQVVVGVMLTVMLVVIVGVGVGVGVALSRN
ncbi:hypothetical protein CMQ_7643 [Grosmannia clavigera kw1407]|uniref:Uncharacterized protein n=1 Tax=Grosmannia clavigera (strain kw1407 / UAMH 11150) TaxID=655863 RepID=F0XP83_GROCL|nr:uncharacterized protein CMQ_7643 [Grosmannia clavigera kw1407]EFX00641.1 hypothetical protein CMQ_7643 [Grosmannia clavigera kw1407]